ncbi:MAG: hypothetical protein AAB542_00105, partial [Patescibacteria group bacterium]
MLYLFSYEIQETVNRLLKGLAHTPIVQIIDRATDVISGRVEDNWTSGFNTMGMIYLAREGLANDREVELTIWHELLHYGIRRYIKSEDYISTMAKLAREDGLLQARQRKFYNSAEGQKMLA